MQSEFVRQDAKRGALSEVLSVSALNPRGTVAHEGSQGRFSLSSRLSRSRAKGRRAKSCLFVVLASQLQ